MSYRSDSIKVAPKNTPCGWLLRGNFGCQSGKDAVHILLKSLPIAPAGTALCAYHSPFDVLPEEKPVIKPKLDLHAIRSLWHMEIQGDTRNGEVDLTFRNTMDAAAFVSSTDCGENARFTFPESVSHFMLPVTITVSNYRIYFNALS